MSPRVCSPQLFLQPWLYLTGRGCETGVPCIKTHTGKWMDPLRRCRVPLHFHDVKQVFACSTIWSITFSGLGPRKCKHHLEEMPPTSPALSWQHERVGQATCQETAVMLRGDERAPGEAGRKYPINDTHTPCDLGITLLGACPRGVSRMRRILIWN